VTHDDLGDRGFRPARVRVELAPGALDVIQGLERVINVRSAADCAARVRGRVTAADDSRPA
jgi:hypothetical protein